MTSSSRRIPQGPEDDDDQVMALFRSLPDADIDDLLAGRTPTSPVVAALTEFVAVVRSDAERNGAPPMSDALRRQIAAAPVPVPSSTSRRRRALVAGIAGLVFGTSAVGLAGAQNALPAVLQDATSSAAELIGIDLPRASERDAGDDADDDAPAGTEQDGEDGSDGTGTGSGSEGTSSGGSPEGPKDTTPGGAVPADPGTPGDHEPATPATPPTGHGQGGGSGQGNGSGATPATPADPSGDGPATPATPADPGSGNGGNGSGNGHGRGGSKA